MRTKEEREAFLLAKMREVDEAAFKDGFELGVLTFSNKFKEMIRANAATHVAGTEVPEGEDINELQKREGWRWK